MNQQTLSALNWSVADLLRGDFKQSEYGRVILPFSSGCSRRKKMACYSTSVLPKSKICDRKP